MFLFLLFVANSLILSFSYSIYLFLICLVASDLTLFRLFPFIPLESCNNFSLACSYDIIIMS
jgi:hypothetical protein